jgi:DNA-directed RNA polymerase subunit RPC12/RpoP
MCTLRVLGRSYAVPVNSTLGLAMDAFVFLRKEWIVSLSKLGSVALVGGLLIAILFSLLQIIDFSKAMLIVILLSFISEFTSWWATYNLIKCPECGHRLCRFKNGKKMPIKQAYSSLRKGVACKNCGWVPTLPP